MISAGGARQIHTGLSRYGWQTKTAIAIRKMLMNCNVGQSDLQVDLVDFIPASATKLMLQLNSMFSWILVKSLSVLQLNPSVVAVATFPCSHHFRFLSPLAWKIWTGNSPIVSQDVSIRNSRRSRGETEFSVSICFNQKFNMFPNVTHQPINHDLSLRPLSPRFSVFPWNALLLGRRGTECTVLSTWCLNLRPFLGLQVPVLSIHSCWKKS